MQALAARIALACAIAFTAATTVACVAEPIDPDQGEQLSSSWYDITKADCDKLGNPFPGCNTEATKESCNRTWNTDGWKDGKPICLGFGKDIDKYGKECNRLKIDDWTLCKNKLFLDCAKKGLLPGQGKGKACFVTKPGDITPPGSWPDSGQVTAREMCYWGVPSDEDVEKCRKSVAGAKKLGCACVSDADVLADAGDAAGEVAVFNATVGEGEGDVYESMEACQAAVAEDTACATETAAAQ